MTEIICEYEECEFRKEGRCTRDKIKVSHGAWDDDPCPVCLTGFWGEGVDRNNELLDWKCPLCGGDVEMQAVATVCLSCGVSLDPDTHIPYKSDGKVVNAT